MATYMLRRMVSTIAVMAMVGIFVFLLLRLAPGDPASIIAGDTATPQMIAGIREKLGLDDPLPAQFVRWALAILGGDFGTSIFAGRPVLHLISQRLEPTISLSILTLVFSATIGVTFGDTCRMANWRHR
ncbi:ABC-type dipeptide/oligopeptide/nickel transport system permease component [Bradyrhizobium sp. LM3.6]